MAITLDSPPVISSASSTGSETATTGGIPSNSHIPVLHRENVSCGHLLVVDGDGNAYRAISLTSLNRYHVRAVALQDGVANEGQIDAAVTGVHMVLFETPPNAANIGSKVWLSHLVNGTAVDLKPVTAGHASVEIGTLIGVDGVVPYGLVKLDPRVDEFFV